VPHVTKEKNYHRALGTAVWKIASEAKEGTYK